MKELEKEVGKLDKSFGLIKVNLVHETGDNEGIWAVPADATSAAKTKNDNSNGEFVMVRLCNQPLGWNNLTWGGLVRAKTKGSMRPDAFLEDQGMPLLDSDKSNLGNLVVEELAKIEKKTKKSKKTKAKK
jgi:hypothetical protein